MKRQCQLEPLRMRRPPLDGTRLPLAADADPSVRFLHFFSFFNRLGSSLTGKWAMRCCIRAEASSSSDVAACTRLACLPTPSVRLRVWQKRQQPHCWIYRLYTYSHGIQRLSSLPWAVRMHICFVLQRLVSPQRFRDLGAVIGIWSREDRA
jgi:hypothetical protein